MKIKLFGIVQEIIGKSEFDFPFQENMTIENLQIDLAKKYPKLQEINQFAFAINETYATKNEKIKENDIIAIIPPVSGG